MCTSNNNRILSRTVILRKVDRKKRYLFFYTDIRSKKVSDIKNNKNITLHIYNEKNKLQVQLFGKAFLENKTVNTKIIWKNLNIHSKKNYSATINPGAIIKSYNNLNNSSNDDFGYKNFCLLKIKIIKMDCLQLLKDNNIRALFDYEEENIKKKWIMP